MVSPLCAQSDFDQFKAERNQKFSQYEAEARQKYEAFRDKTNAEFADFMPRTWKAVESKPAIPSPPRPEPPVPVVKDPDSQTVPATVRLTDFDIAPLEPILPQPVPAVPVVVKPETEKRPITLFSFQFYNTPCEVHLDASQRFKLSDVKEQAVADAWRAMTNDLMDLTLWDCLNLRDYMQLSDWGYVDFLKALTESFYGKPCPEAVLMQMYLLTQSGYKVRLARQENRLVLLLPFSDEVYELSFFDFAGTKFYIIDKKTPDKKYYVLDYEFPKETMPSLCMRTLPTLNEKMTDLQPFTSNRYSNLKVEVAINRNLMDFYNNYPRNWQWQYYVLSSLSDEVKSRLYPALKAQLAGKSQKEAVSLLLNFVQTAFAYKTDEDQFGYERPLFGDETFFYPFSDCEDRSILFAILVRELVGLDVVLLLYPEHLAAAVKFTEPKPNGYYFHLKDGDYVICDPTYINADIGEPMPKFKDKGATIIKI